MKRRDFLRHLGAGSALACLPFGLRESFAASMNLPDLVITDLGVFSIGRGAGVKLLELAPGVTLDEVKAKTEAEFEVAL